MIIKNAHILFLLITVTLFLSFMFGAVAQIHQQEKVYIHINKVYQKVFYTYEDEALFEEVGKTYQIRYAYDDNGKKLAEKYTSVNTNYLKRYDYNVNGERVYATNGYILYTNKFNYDYEGQLIEEVRYNYSGAYLLKKRFKYVYDKAGNWTSLVNKNKTGSYFTIREIQYN